MFKVQTVCERGFHDSIGTYLCSIVRLSKSNVYKRNSRPELSVYRTMPNCGQSHSGREGHLHYPWLWAGCTTFRNTYTRPSTAAEVLGGKAGCVCFPSTQSLVSDISYVICVCVLILCLLQSQRRHTTHVQSLPRGHHLGWPAGGHSYHRHRNL